MSKLPFIYRFQKGAKMKHYIIKFLSLIVVGLFFSGCIPAIRTQQFDINSSTEGSKISVYDKNNNKVFESTSTSATANLLICNKKYGGGAYLVEITKEGYEPITTLISPEFDVDRIVGSIFWGTLWPLGNLSPRIINADLESGTVTVFNTSDWYSTIKYGMPLGGMPLWGHLYMESGRIWRNGVFCGTDINFGISGSDESGGEKFALSAGYGFDAGVVNDLPVEEDLKLVYGGAVGFWFTHDIDEYNGYYRYNYNFLAPFVKLRWKFLELSYRGLLGVGVQERRYRYYDSYYGEYNNYYYDADAKFGWNNHQLALGLYFEGSKRKGVTLRRR